MLRWGARGRSLVLPPACEPKNDLLKKTKPRSSIPGQDDPLPPPRLYLTREVPRQAFIGEWLGAALRTRRRAPCVTFPVKLEARRSARGRPGVPCRGKDSLLFGPPPLARSGCISFPPLFLPLLFAHPTFDFLFSSRVLCVCSMNRNWAYKTFVCFLSSVFISPKK